MCPIISVSSLRTSNEDKALNNDYTSPFSTHHLNSSEHNDLSALCLRNETGIHHKKPTDESKHVTAVPSDECLTSVEYESTTTNQVYLCTEGSNSEHSRLLIGLSPGATVPRETDSALLVFGCGPWQKPKLIDGQGMVVAYYETVERNDSDLLPPTVQSFTSNV